MQKYFYHAVDINKKAFKGYFLAENEEDLRLKLSQQKLFLISAKPVSDKPPQAFFSVTGKVSVKELTTFCRQFAIMIDSGISIVESLDVLKDQAYSSFFRRVINNVYEDVKVGHPLSEAMSKHKKVFPNFFTSMTYVGEQSGMLDDILRSVADYYETESKIKSKTKSAMIYPVFLLCLMLAIIVLMVVFVIPTFEDALSKLEVEMPALTMAILDVSHWFTENWMYPGLGVIVIGFIIFLAGRTEKGKYFFDTLKIKLPIVKNVQISLISARFARGFGLLMSGGMDIIEAMQVISSVLGNKNVERRFNFAINDVKEGKSLTQALNDHKLFPMLLIQMVSVGEKTGNVDRVLLDSSSYFDLQAERSLNAMVSMIQPVMLVLMGGVVGVLFYSIYAPMLSIMQTL